MRIQITRRDGPSGHLYAVTGDPRVTGDLLGVTTYLNVINKGQGLLQWYANKAVDKVKQELSETTWAVPEGVLEQVPDDLFDGIRWRHQAPWIDGIVERARKRPNEARDEASDFGTQAHALIARLIEGHPVKVPHDYRQVMDNFLAWQREAGIDLVAGERMVYSAVHGYATTLDIEGRYPDEMPDYGIPIVEVKTSNRLYREHEFQVVAEGKALEETAGVHVSQYWLLRLGKDRPEFEAKQILDVDTCFEGFLAAKRLYEALRGGYHGSP